MDILATSSIVQSFTPSLDQGIRQQSQFSWQGIVCGERQWNDNKLISNVHRSIFCLPRFLSLVSSFVCLKRLRCDYTFWRSEWTMKIVVWKYESSNLLVSLLLLSCVCFGGIFHVKSEGPLEPFRRVRLKRKYTILHPNYLPSRNAKVDSYKIC